MSSNGERFLSPLLMTHELQKALEILSARHPPAIHRRGKTTRYIPFKFRHFNHFVIDEAKDLSVQLRYQMEKFGFLGGLIFRNSILQTGIDVVLWVNEFPLISIGAKSEAFSDVPTGRSTVMKIAASKSHEKCAMYSRQWVTPMLCSMLFAAITPMTTSMAHPKRQINFVGYECKSFSQLINRCTTLKDIVFRFVVFFSLSLPMVLHRSRERIKFVGCVGRDVKLIFAEMIFICSQFSGERVYDAEKTSCT